MAPPNRHPLAAGVAAAAITVAALAAGATLAGRDDVESPTRHDPGAAAELVAAYRRSRAATFAVEQTFSRRLVSGARVDLATVVAQRPGSRITRTDDSVSGVVDEREVACQRIEDGGGWRCRRGVVVDLAATAAREAAALRSLVDGPVRRYDVTSGGPGCFRLRLVAPGIAPPYGSGATLCFDPATGAPTRTDVRRDEGVDRTRAIRVSDPDPSLFVLPG